MNLLLGQFSKWQKSGFAMLALTLIAIFAIVPLSKADNVKFDSARDCDNNAVLHCGAMSANELIEKYSGNGSAKDIYDFFGISKKDVNNIKQNVVAGKITDDGKVKVNGKVVATDAKTAGRENMPGSNKVTHDGTTFFVRKPNVSFQSNSLDAYVVMKDGVFDFAIIASCGNPVEADAKANPKYEMNKKVRVPGGDWKNADAINYGEQFEYKVAVTNTGTGPVRNLFIKDAVPADITRVPNSLTRDGEPASDTNFFGNEGIRIGRLPQGEKVTFIFKATSTQKTQPVPCTEKSPVNVAHSNGGSLPAQTDKATVTLKCKNVPPPTTPSYKIVKQVQLIGSQEWLEDITVPNGTEVRYRIVVASDGSAPVTNLVVGDVLPAGVTYTAGTLTQNNIAVANANQFFSGGINIGTLANGKFTVFVFNALVGTKDLTAKCEPGALNNVASIKADKLAGLSDNAIVNKQCQPQKISCDLLTAKSLGDRKFQFNVKYSATPGATYKSSAFNFGDNSSILVTDKTTAEYTYKTDGTFTASATLTFMVDGKSQTVTSENCQVKVSAKTPPNMCVIPGKEHLPADSPDCVNEPLPVVPEGEASLPNTGPGEVLGLFMGISAIGAMAYRVWVGRNQ